MMMMMNARSLSFLLVLLIGWSEGEAFSRGGTVAKLPPQQKKPPASQVVVLRGGGGASPLLEAAAAAPLQEQAPVEEDSTTPTVPILLSQDSPFMKAATICAACAATWVVNNLLASGAVAASAWTAWTAAAVLPEKLALAALCGSFAGMASIAVIPSATASVALGMLTAAVCHVFDKKGWFVGVGGRLGFIAQTACTLQFLLQKYLLPVNMGSGAALVDLSLYKSIKLSQTAPLILWTVAGAFFMRLWKHYGSKLSSRTGSSTAAVGATGLLFGLALPAAAAGPAYCGSFVAMAGPSVIGSAAALAAASALAACSVTAMTGLLLGGWGGRLGTAALIGVQSYTWIVAAVSKLLAGPKTTEVTTSAPVTEIPDQPQQVETTKEETLETVGASSYEMSPAST